MVTIVTSLKTSLFFSLLFMLLFPVIGNSQTPDKVKDSNIYKQLDTFAEVFEIVRKQYVHKLSDKEIIQAAISGMLTRLDPHSAYFNNETLKNFSQSTKGQFGGLGIQVSMRNELAIIIAPIEDSPAEKAGLQSGDYISHVNGKSIRGLSLSEIVNHMRGKVGTPIELTITRKGVDAFNVKIIRDIIVNNPISWQRYENTGYIRLRVFSEQSFSSLATAIKNLESGRISKRNKKIVKKPITGYILDLRNNAGGLLDQSVKISDAFLERGEIVSMHARDTRIAQRFQAKSGDLIKGKPLVVLINIGSASASEIVAAALKVHKRALLMGTQSFGKGSVQSIIPLKNSNGGAIKLTIQLYYTPDGSSIQGVGVTPDVIVEQAQVIPIKQSVLLNSESAYQSTIVLEENKKKNRLSDEQFLSNKIADRRKKDYQLSRALDAVKLLALRK